MDRVNKEDDGSLHVVDYKTGDVLEELGWTQFRLHALLLSHRSLCPVRKLSVLYLASMALESEDIEDDDLEHIRWDVLTAASGIRREKRFAPMPGPWCRGCDFPAICPKVRLGTNTYSGRTAMDVEHVLIVLLPNHPGGS